MSTVNKLKRGLCWVMLTGSLIFYMYFLFTMGVSGIFNYLLPCLFTTLVWGFYITAFILYLRKSTNVHALLVKIALLLQSFQFAVNGYVFRNYFGPYVGFGFTNIPDFHFRTLVHPFSFQLTNGLKRGSDETSLSVNLVILLLFILFAFWKENEVLLEVVTD